MTLRSDIERVRDESLAALVEAHDYFAYSRQLWRGVLARGRRAGRPLVLSNPVTGSRASGPGLRSVAATSVGSYLPSATVQQFTSVAESFLGDVVRLWVVAFPHHCRTPVDVQTIVAAPDRAAILYAMADQFVAAMTYKVPRDWFKQLNTIVDLGVPSDDRVDAFAELKATRDVFVHQRGIANAVYHRKAGRLARAAIGQPLDLPDTYVHESWSTCHTIVADVGTAAAARAPAA